jgi:Protein NO VEIN, C-terminal
MKTSDAAVAIVKAYFARQNITLLDAKRGDVGYDLKNADETLFVEVKGSAKKKPHFRYFTNSEYEKARVCRRNKLKYEVHIIIGITDGTCLDHLRITGDDLIREASPEIHWNYPIRKATREKSVMAKHKTNAPNTALEPTPTAH